MSPLSCRVVPQSDCAFTTNTVGRFFKRAARLHVRLDQCSSCAQIRSHRLATAHCRCLCSSCLLITPPSPSRSVTFLLLAPPPRFVSSSRLSCSFWKVLLGKLRITNLPHPTGPSRCPDSFIIQYIFIVVILLI